MGNSQAWDTGEEGREQFFQSREIVGPEQVVEPCDVDHRGVGARGQLIEQGPVEAGTNLLIRVAQPVLDQGAKLAYRVDGEIPSLE